MNNRYTQTHEYPRTTGELIKYIAGRVPERLVKSLPISIAAGLISWLLHTVIMVAADGSFNTETWVAKNLLNVGGRLFSSSVLWLTIGAIVPMAISFIRRKQNPADLVKSMVSLPGQIINTNNRSGGRFLPIMLFSCAATLLVDVLLSGVTSMVLGGVVMSSVVAFLTGRGSIFVQMLRMIFQDVQLFILKQQKLRLDGDNVLMVIGVSGVTLFAVGALKAIFTQVWIIMVLLRWLWLVALILGIIAMSQNKNVPRQFAFIIGVLGMSALLSASLAKGISAYDGGLGQASVSLVSMSFSCWLQNNCTFWAIMHGFPLAVASAIGALISAIVEGLLDGLTPGYMDQDAGISEEETARQEEERKWKTLNEPYLGMEDTHPELVEKLKEELEERRKRERIEKLAEKYGTTYEGILKRRELCDKYNCNLSEVMDIHLKKEGEKINSGKFKRFLLGTGYYATKGLEIGCDIGVDVLGEHPGTGAWGKVIRAGYKIGKGAVAEGATARIEGRDIKQAMKGGAIKGTSDAVSDYVKSPSGKYAIRTTGKLWGGYVSNEHDGALNGAKAAIAEGVMVVGAEVFSGITGGVLDWATKQINRRTMSATHYWSPTEVLDNEVLELTIREMQANDAANKALQEKIYNTVNTLLGL